ncbi:MAG: AAA family ATPase [bacterium]
MKKIFVGATRQNRGKTTLSLGLISAFKKRLLNVGFIKPIGQRYVELNGEMIDEDVVLVENIYGSDCPIKDMSPIAINQGFTTNYIEGKIQNRQQLVDQIQKSFEVVSKGKDIVVVEGTGHSGVGSVFDLSNADVAKILDVKALLVSAGGVGGPIDEIMLNKTFFDVQGVKTIGAVVNKIEMDKFDRINNTVRKGLTRKGIETLGVIPFVPLLSFLTMELIIDSIDGELLAGKDKLDLLIKNIVVGAMPAHEALDYFGERVLIITPGSRDDIILALMSSYTLGEQKGEIAGMILTGGTAPHPSIMKLIEKSQIPTLLVKKDIYTTASCLHDLLVKVRPKDTKKIDKIVNIVSGYVDVDRMLDLI